MSELTFEFVYSPLPPFPLQRTSNSRQTKPRSSKKSLLSNPRTLQSPPQHGCRDNFDVYILETFKLYGSSRAPRDDILSGIPKGVFFCVHTQSLTVTVNRLGEENKKYNAAVLRASVARDED